MAVQLLAAVVLGLVFGFLFGDLVGALILGSAGVVVGGLLERMHRLEKEIDELKDEIQQGD